MSKDGLEIKKANTQKFTEKTINDFVVIEKDSEIQRTGTAPNLDPGMSETKKRTKPATAAELKKKSENIPVIVPKQAKDMIRDLHTQLSEEEKQYFEGPRLENIHRKRYDTMSASDIKKRAENALKRQKNARDILEFEKSGKGRKIGYSHIDKEKLIKNIKLFKQMRDIPYEMDTDEKFVANLELNYQLCESADHMKHWLEEASEGGFMPEGEDMAELQAKVETFAEVKRYLDAQKNLMKNPFYQYMAKEDVSYSDEDLEVLRGKTKNADLKDYLTNVSIIRSLHFVRRKGLTSAEKYGKAQGKRAAELLATRNEKRDILGKMSESMLNFAGTARFLDKDYDTRFTPQLFDDTLRQFKSLNFKDLHFGSIRDIAEHLEENQYIFNRVHDMEHLLMLAVQKGMAPADEELIELRAKMETFLLAERTIAHLEKKVLSDPDSFVTDTTYKEMEESLFDTIRKEVNTRHEPVRIGGDLNKFFKSVSRRYKKKHKDRAKEIRLTYGLTHPQNANDGDLALGNIPAEELAKREREYQKNSVIADYMRHSEEYINNYLQYIESIDAAYAHRTGRPRLGSFGRTLSPYLTGMPASEIIKVIDIMKTGTAEQKEDLWKKVGDEVFKLNISDYGSKDRSVFYSNAANKLRAEKILANIGGGTSDFKKYVKDDKYLKLADAYYGAGTSNAFLSAVAQAAAYEQYGSVTFEDWHVENADDIYGLVQQIEAPNEDVVSLEVNGQTIEMPEAEWLTLSKSVERIHFIRAAGYSAHKKDRAKANIRNNAFTDLYENLKANGLYTDATAEELKEVSDHYRKYLEDHKDLNADLIANAEANKDKNDIASRQERTKAIEKVFEKIMSFDIGKFEFSSIRDIIANNEKYPTRFDDCFEIAQLAKKASEMIADYRELCKDDKTDSLLEDVHVDEIQARCELIGRAGVFFDERFARVISSPELSGLGMSFDELLHMMPEEYDRKIADIEKSEEQETDEIKKERNKVQKELWKDLKAMNVGLAGYDIGQPLARYEQSVREKNGLSGESRTLETYNRLAGIESPIEGYEAGEIKLVCQSESAFRSQFNRTFSEKNYTVSEREKLLYSKKSEVCKKRENYENLKDQSLTADNEKISARRKISLKTRIAIGDERLNDLSAFMGENEEMDHYMAEGYADQKSRDNIMDLVTMDLLETNIDIVVVSDEDFAKNAYDLETISRKAIAYKNLIKANPEYRQRLMVRRPGVLKSDLDLVNERLERMLAISDYYRARRVLMTDSYYILHGSEEISVNRDSAASEDQKRVADLINLVALCTRRLDGEEKLSRQDADRERVLAQAELRGKQNAYLTGRPDLTKVDPSKAYQAHKEIERFVQHTGIADYANENSQSKKIVEANADLPFPEAEKYRTENAGNFFKMMQRYQVINFSVTSRDKMNYNARESELEAKLRELLVDKTGSAIHNFLFEDPVTNEKWAFDTDATRMIIPAIKLYGEGMPEEEILEIFEGFFLCERTDIDLHNEEQRLYARKRWLDSAQKLFMMEYNNVKRYEKTYGTLEEELPTGCFMQSLGGTGMLELPIRNLFSQDLAQLCDRAEKNCISDGKKITLGELLVKNGMVSQSVLDNMNQLGPNYYQNIHGDLNPYYMSAKFFGDPEGREELAFNEDHFVEWEHTRDNNNIQGPGLKQTECRKIWKNALKYKRDKNLIGSGEAGKFYSRKLDLYTGAEKENIKKTRAQDVGIFHFYNAYLDDISDDLIMETTKKVGKEISLELLRKLIVFHPAMLHSVQTVDGQKKYPEGTEEFYDIVRKFAGIGIPEEHRAAAKKEASEGLFRLWNETFGNGVVRNELSTDTLMAGSGHESFKNGARTDPDSIREGSNLYIGEVRHRMFESIRDPELISGFADCLRSSKVIDIEKRVTQQIRQEIIRNRLTDRFYLDMKDFGSKRKSYSERMYQEIDKLLVSMKSSAFDIEEALQDKDFVEKLKYYGVNTDGLSVLIEFSAGQRSAEKNMADQRTVDYSTRVPEFAKQEAAQKDKTGRQYYELDPIPHESVISVRNHGEYVKYESQGENTSYCWACVMSGLMNSYAGKKISDLNMIKNRPLEIPSFKQSGVKDPETYYRGMEMINSMYEGTAYGNPTIFGDYILDKLPDTAVRSAIISREEGRLPYCKRRFLETLSKALEKGNVGMLYEGHFLLVGGLSNDTIWVRDSLSDNPDELQPFPHDAEDIFSSVGQQIELVWLESTKDRENEIADQFDLKYDAQTKSYSFKNDQNHGAGGPGEANFGQMKNEQTILHQNGIESMTQLYDDVVFNSVYVPKKKEERHQTAPAGEQILQNAAEEKTTEKKAEEKKTEKKAEESDQNM